MATFSRIIANHNKLKVFHLVHSYTIIDEKSTCNNNEKTKKLYNHTHVYAYNQFKQSAMPKFISVYTHNINIK